MFSLERCCSGDRAPSHGSSCSTLTRMLLNVHESHPRIAVSLQAGPLSEGLGKDRADGRRTTRLARLGLEALCKAHGASVPAGCSVTSPSPVTPTDTASTPARRAAWFLPWAGKTGSRTAILSSLKLPHRETLPPLGLSGVSPDPGCDGPGAARVQSQQLHLLGGEQGGERQTAGREGPEGAWVPSHLQTGSGPAWLQSSILNEALPGTSSVVLRD